MSTIINLDGLTMLIDGHIEIELIEIELTEGEYGYHCVISVDNDEELASSHGRNEWEAIGGAWYKLFRRKKIETI